MFSYFRPPSPFYPHRHFILEFVPVQELYVMKISLTSLDIKYFLAFHTIYTCKIVLVDELLIEH